MAWEICPWCNEKHNGWFKAQSHAKKMHPVEFAIRDAQRVVQHREDNVQQTQLQLDTYRILTTYLEQDMPEIVRSFLEKGRQAQLLRYRGDTRTDEDILVSRLEVHQESLAEEQAKLAALQPVEVPACLKSS